MKTETMSVLTKSQKKQFGPRFYEECRITARVSHDDQCGNGHNTFSIVCDIEEKHGTRWVDSGGGAAHELIAKHFPNLAPFIKWHLCSTDGPLHYLANTVYHVKHGKLDFARSSAIWPDATDEELTATGLEERLEERLPALMEEFQAAVESLGFAY